MKDDKDSNTNELDNEVYILTPWGILYSILCDYGIDCSSTTSAIGTHLVDDFMDAMTKHGYLIKTGVGKEDD